MSVIILFLIFGFEDNKLADSDSSFRNVIWQNGYQEFENIYELKFSEMELRLASSLKELYPEDIDLDWEEFRKGCK